MVGGSVDFYLHGERVFYSNESRVSGAWAISIHMFMKRKKLGKSGNRVQDLMGKRARAPLPARKSLLLHVPVRVQMADNIIEAWTNFRACLAQNAISM